MSQGRPAVTAGSSRRPVSEEGRANISVAQQRRRNAARRTLPCGHVGLEIGFGVGRCWDCHLDHLRATGDGARADRLVVLKRQREEGTIDWSRMVDGLIAAFEQRDRERELSGLLGRERDVTPLVTGAERLRLPVSRT